MKLNRNPHPVKPDRQVLTVAAVATLLTAASLAIILSVTSQEQRRLDQFGQASAQALAALVAEPLMQRDRMHLSVIGNRLAEAPQIRGVASYAPDQTLLASTGELRSPHYTQPVTVDDQVVGSVRVALAPQAFATPQRGRWVAIAIALLAVPLLTAIGAALLRAVRHGGLDPWRRKLRRADARPTPTTTDHAATEAPPEEDIRHYLLAVNLYNQLTLPADQREFELSLCAELAEAVAEIYQGQVVTLPGVGTLIDFDHTDDPDRPFEVLCAAFLLTRLLHDESPFGQYRLGLNVTERPADETLRLDDEAIADASLLSALARDQALAVSATFPGSAELSEHCHCQPLINPVLDELVTSGPACSLIRELAAPHAGLVAQQVQELKTQREAISNPSTF